MLRARVCGATELCRLASTIECRTIVSDVGILAARTMLATTARVVVGAGLALICEREELRLSALG